MKSVYWFTIILTVRVPVTHKATYSYNTNIRQMSKRTNQEHPKEGKREREKRKENVHYVYAFIRHTQRHAMRRRRRGKRENQVRD